MVNTRKKKEKTPVDQHKSEESGSQEVSKDQKKKQEIPAAQDSDANKESTAESSQPTTEDEGKSEDSSKPSLGLRLVPLNLLLKPEIVNPPKKQSPRKARNAKKSSYIELSSEDSSDQEEEQISIPSSSDSNESEVAKKKRKSTKANSSKHSNGNSSEIFKEPMSPTKITKSSKNLSVNLNKMPGNVNKLMKSYRVESETSVLSWSESDDFENMIETSKIDRSVLEEKSNPKSTTSTEGSTTSQNVVKKRGPKSKTEKLPAKKVKKIPASSSEDTSGPTRSRSTRNAAVNRKKVVEEASSSSSEEESENDQIEDTSAKVVK
jgi:hypothetical protein